MIERSFWKGKRVLVTGHTGFKGAWLCLCLHSLGAEVAGYALAPPTHPSLFDLARIETFLKAHTVADIRDLPLLRDAVRSFGPEIVIHMAAQPLVRYSYREPVETYAVNVMGTVNLLEAVRQTEGVRALVNVTTDKCYENKEWVWGYRENEPMGGYDPYSSSKGCSELVTSAYRQSFFHPDAYGKHGVALATARAGNVIGGGDWAEDRLIPDCVRALLQGDAIQIRHPGAIRPWQHVLEPLSGYLLLAQRLFQEGPAYAEGWNFGPNDEDAKPVEWIVRRMCDKWKATASYVVDGAQHPHEAHFLKLDCSKAKARLGWHPRWSLDKAIDSIVDWTRAYTEGRDLKDVCLEQIEAYRSCEN